MKIVNENIKKMIEKNKLTYYFVVNRKSRLNSEIQIFNDEIQLVNFQGEILFRQACDSIADEFIMKLGRYTKPSEDDYTIAANIMMPIKKATYRNRKTGLREPAYIILSGYSVNKKWKVGKHYSLFHMIHYSSHYDETTPVYNKKKVKRGSSGGCIVLPKHEDNNPDIFDFVEENKINVTQLIINEEF